MVAAGQTLSILGLMVFGTMGSVLSKLVYQLQGESAEGDIRYFRKPWLTTSLMFVAMSFCLPLAWMVDWHKSKKHPIQHSLDEGHQPLLQTLSPNDPHSATTDRIESKGKSTFLLAIPMALDLVATLLMSIGLLYVTASVYQMMRGAEMIFSAGLSVTCLKRRLLRWHYIGIACCLAGITLVGASSLLESQSSKGSNPTMVLLGMFLIVIAQFVQASQVVVEDYAMSDGGMAPLKVVGYEGLFGTLAFCALLPLAQVLPGRDGDGIHEDTRDSWHLIRHSIPPWAIPTALAVQALGLLLYNIAGMFVTSDLGALTRTVLESMRTLFVWLADLALFYTVSHKLGEPWDKGSYLQGAGFVVLVAGTLVYSRGDQKEEEDVIKAREALKIPRKAGTAFRPSMTIRAMPLHTVARNRWRHIGTLALAAARLEHAGRQARSSRGHMADQGMAHETHA
eukprot:jgi/Botrbrau1/10626/Bobra.154_1s0015.1